MLIVDLPADLAEDAVALWHASGLTRPWNDPHADLARALAGPSSTVLAAVDDSGLLCGTSMVGHDGHRGWVYYVAVRAEHRRAGLGRRLMNASEEWLVERRVPKVQLMVRTANAAVVTFYSRLGYEHSDVLVLGKFLNV
ncbi:MAG: GNAT family acetyltransferase [Actinobacteria bacterium]|nr:GNAT family acetyltransferase [Actinomycetota bacterium]MCA1721633.1 GNAT family acetyltransferase [Actinomycetota bacterium]